MSKQAALSILLILVLTMPVFGDDLCLVTIDSHETLEKVKTVSESAHGLIDGRFIVDLDKNQMNYLKRSGIEVESIASNYEPDRLYRADRFNSSGPEFPLAFASKFSSQNSHILEINRSEVDILQRAGYMVIPIAQKETPLFYNPPLLGLPAMPGYPSDSLADLINQDSLYSYVTRLENFQTRFIMTSGNAQARQWIKSKFLSFGYTDVSIQQFGVTSNRYDYELENYPAYNVLCYKPGTQKPDKLIVIGAHYDTVNLDADDYGLTYSPGADDNATGTAAVLELARILKDVETNYTVVFAAFSAEEWGLFGSEHLASVMDMEDAKVVLMMNFDMLGNVYSHPNIIKYYCGWSDAYYDAFSAAASRIAGMTTINEDDACSSDDRSFYNFGFSSLCTHEYDFNNNIHSDYDISSILNFDYMENLVKVSAAGFGVTDNAAEPVEFHIYDYGDGQTLRIVFENCTGDMTYSVLSGTSSYNGLTDTVEVPAGACYYDMTGLTLGHYYNIGVTGVPSVGDPPLGIRVLRGVPRENPITPQDLTLAVDSTAMTLSWKPNSELDLNHYKIIRVYQGGGLDEIEGNYTDTTYVDLNVDPYTEYQYSVIAVDNDLNESDTAAFVSGVLTTFDRGILFVDETQEGGDNPSNFEQNQFYHNMLDTLGFDTEEIDSLNPFLKGSLAGQYNPVFWIDDDNSHKYLSESLDTLEWYLGYNTDLLLAGWSTIYDITGHSYFYSGNFFYDNLGISYIAQNILPDFTGATGVGDWPDLEVRVEPPYDGRLPDINIFTEATGAEVIYTFNAYSGNPFYDGKPAAVALDTHHGKRVVLGFPLYYLTESSVQAFISRLMDYYAEESVLYGDVNGDWSMNILDVTYLINFLYRDGPPPADMNNADPNGSCAVNILDATYLINYLYKSGQEPVVGCVE